ncbi:MAG: glycosyltransferase family 2 protein [Moorea sp. SIOASIH]|uniref:hormogonium polysaccharide biosynthesis glycosyltransferase HpsE n=1 Tax=Moorena sp. SIOASIH TaxID=2607817 RepID=UPI0013BA8D86|nr:hormogonium polysaccharide biosynthesis glycosyltransferase HpsE [Moorena sp. SIOASIH]NEO37435.1 glycosyltransferase family 2 protein [Moorena sp. SIOASIH]
MAVDFTVAIPTYNGAKRLPLLLERLRSQISLNPISWEIIVVDNNSSDDTAQVIQDYQSNWDLSVPLRYCFELEQGSAFARLRAVQEAKGELIGFLDDDNLPDPNWIAEAYDFGQEYPKAGAYSGQIHGEFEVEPPENFDPIKQFLAIREHGPNPHPFQPEEIRLPPGASLVVRRQAWLDSVPPRPSLTGKLPGLFVQGDDYEPLLYMYKAGWEIWYNPAMHSYHQIPQWRLQRDYLLTLARGCGLATCQLRLINATFWQKPIVITKTLLGNLRRFILHFLKYRGQFKTNLIAAFQLEFFWGSLISPFFAIRKLLQNKGTGNREQGTGSREQGAGSREQGAGNRDK